MGDAFIDVLEVIPRGLVYVGMGVLILALAKAVQDILTPYKISEQLTHRDNVALAVSITGYYIGIIIVFIGALYQPFDLIADGGLGFTADYWQDVLEVFLYSIAGIAVLNISRVVVDKLVLHQFSTEKEIITDHNVGTGVVEMGVYIAVSLVIAGSISGSGSSTSDVSIVTTITSSLAFFGLGLVALILYTLFYEFVTSYSIHEEIEKDNVAVGVALAANLVAVGIIAFKATFGEFVSWEDSLAGFFTFGAIGFALLFFVRMAVDFLLFPRVKLAHELAVDRNVGAAFIVGSSVISVAAILFFAV